MHRLSHIVIKNFRACRRVSLSLESYTPLVGQNNTGKSTILQAIAWVLKPAALAAKDFYDPSKPVEVIACVDGISHQVLDLIPEPKHRKAIEPYCRQGRLWIRVTTTGTNAVNLRLKRYHSLALQTVPVGDAEPDSGQVVLFDLDFFGRRPGWRFGTV